MMNQSLLAVSSNQERRQMAPLPTVTILGKVSKVGFYRDTLPLLIINIKKEDATSLPYRTGERVAIPFMVNGRPYLAGLRATARSATVMICSDLFDGDLNPVRLADVLFSVGWTQREAALVLTIRNGVVCCL